MRIVADTGAASWVAWLPTCTNDGVGRELVVLVVEDDASTRRGVARLLGLDARVEPVEAADGLEALEVLESRAIDVVISDEVMPRLNGLRLLETIRSRWPATRRVLFTGHPDAQLVIDAINRGGVDKVLTKGTTAEELRTELEEVFDDCLSSRIDPSAEPRPVVSSIPHEERPRVLVAVDELALRSAVANVLASNFSVATTSVDGIADMLDQDWTVAVLDLPNRAAAGREALQRLHNQLPDCPSVVLVPRNELPQAHDAMRLGAYRYLVHPLDRDALSRTVEKAIKWRRLGQLRRAATESVMKRELLQVQFERALDELYVVYQPIVRVSDQTVLGYEALVRSREPSLPHPGALFDAAAQLGRTIDIGKAVRRVAPRPFLKDADSPLLFINLHVEDVVCDDLLDSPLASIAHRVVLEITERASFESVDDLVARTVKLRAKGYRIAIDDLGAGYAGLSAVANLDPDIVKVDMSLTRGVHMSKTKSRLVGGLQETCSDLELPMVAEGVETKDELLALCSVGVDLFQGFLFARPAPELQEIHWG